MTDDPHHHLAQQLHQLADAVRQLEAPAEDWVGAWEQHDVLSTDEVAGICGVSSDTIRRRAEASAAEGFALGIRCGGVWLLSLRRVLIWVEKHQNRHARLQCESRARKFAELRPKPQKVPETVPDAVSAAS